jgi:hypothetical protein
MISQSESARYLETGLLRIDGLLSQPEVAALANLVDDLMLGERSLSGMFFQLDPNSPDYSKVNFEETNFVGPSLNYRKIKDLEYVPEFLAAVQGKKVEEIAHKFVGSEVSTMRTMVVNKPSMSQTPLPWHQDISNDWPMSQRPILTIWIALDAVDEENGCVEWLAGSHLQGEVDGGHLTSDSSLSSLMSNFPIVKGILKPGDAVVFDNAVIHRSQPNISGRRRRGLTLCLMKAETYNTKTNTYYPKIFGTDALTPSDVAKLKQVPLNRPKDFGE